MPSLESKIPPPAVVLVIGVFMWLVSRAAPSLHFDVPVHNWLAAVLVSAGFLTGVSGVVTFLRAKTTVDPTKPRASSLVTWGVYAISRNPMYLGGFIMLLGWAVFLSNALALLCASRVLPTLTGFSTGSCASSLVEAGVSTRFALEVVASTRHFHFRLGTKDS
jgi:protein-S-isoprenylcysteine O-methyltransferase Ste14